MSRLLRNLIQFPLFAGEDAGSGGGTEPTSIHDILNADDDEIDDAGDDDASEDKTSSDVDETESQETEDSESDSGDKEEVKDELSQFEEELGEVDEDKLQASETMPRRSEILAKYPKLFKDFPGLQTAYYREQKFTEYFAHPNDAKEALEKANERDHLDTLLMSGKTAEIFQAVRESDINAFHVLVDNLLEDLGRVDENAQMHILRNVGKHIISGMVGESNRSGNEALKAAAQIVNQFMTGSSDWEPPSKLGKAPQKTAENEQLTRERSEFQQQRYDLARGEVATRAHAYVSQYMKVNLDPNDKLPPFVREAAEKKVHQQLHNLLNRDTRFKTILNGLWGKASKSLYSKADQDNIAKAYNLRAKALLPAVVKSVRNEAFKGLGRRIVETDNVKDKKGPVSSGKSVAPGNNGRNLNPRSRAAEVRTKFSSVKAYLDSDED